MKCFSLFFFSSFCRRTKIQTLGENITVSTVHFDEQNIQTSANLTLPLTAKCASSQIYVEDHHCGRKENPYLRERCKFYHLFKLKMCLNVEVWLRNDRLNLFVEKFRSCLFLGVLACNRICASFKMLPFCSRAPFLSVH